MKVNRDRAWRRFENKKAELKAFNQYLSVGFYYSGNKTKEEKILRIKKTAKILKNNMKNCSCFMCGNPRKKMFKGCGKAKLTLQELKALDILKSQDFN